MKTLPARHGWQAGRQSECLLALTFFAVTTTIGISVGGPIAEVVYGDACTRGDRLLFQLVIGLVPTAALVMNALYRNVRDNVKRPGQDEPPPGA